MSRKEVSMIGNLTRDMMRDVMETSLKKPIQTGEFRKNPVEPAWRCPNDYIYELIPTGKFVMEYLKPKQAVTGRVILQLHGGGYIGPMKNIYRRFAVKYSELGFGADVLTPDYRVAPEHPFPAALEDAVYAYKWLLNEKKIRSGTDRGCRRFRGRRTCPRALSLRKGSCASAPGWDHHDVPLDGCDAQRGFV